MYNVLAMNIHVTQPCQMTKYGKNDLHSSNSTPVVHKGEVLLANNYCSLAKSEELDSLSNAQHVLTILNNK